MLSIGLWYDEADEYDCDLGEYCWEEVEDDSFEELILQFFLGNNPPNRESLCWFDPYLVEDYCDVDALVVWV